MMIGKLCRMTFTSPSRPLIPLWQYDFIASIAVMLFAFLASTSECFTTNQKFHGWQGSRRSWHDKGLTASTCFLLLLLLLSEEPARGSDRGDGFDKDRRDRSVKCENK